MSKAEGFTLIEIIVAITTVAVLAAFFVQFMGRAFMGSAREVNTLNETYEINQVVAKLTAGYKDELANGTLDLESWNYAALCDNGIVCSGMFLKYRSGEDLIDTNSDGIYEAQEVSPGPTNFLMVTASKNNQSIRVLFTE
ncbi:type II secretion system protein [Thermodesulfobacteriota bacterium]